MHVALPHPLAHPVRYDAERRRLWILGQRCHHGATGAVLTASAGVVLAGKQLLAPSRATLAGARAVSHAAAGTALVAAVGSLLMLHDWKDHSIWFERGRGSQP